VSRWRDGLEADAGLTPAAHRGRPAVTTALVVIAAAMGAAGCFSERASGLPAEGSLRAVQVASGLSNPLYLTAPAGDDRLFVVEQSGRVQIIKGGVVLPQPFLDVTARVLSGGERGLLSIAFHPLYATNGYVYVSYTDLAGDTRIERYSVRPTSADAADPTSAQLILSVAQPYANHNGGLVVFGPDGMFYVGLGDGGSGGDPQNNGQNRGTLLGKLLRLDVDGGTPYAIPAGNPFIGQAGARPEIWALGLRNPWRFAFDRVSGLLYVADVGQNQWEEISVVAANRPGVNYGWRILEGSQCYAAATCNTQGLERPVVEYSHDDGCSITGGLSYRGSLVPAIVGHYFYSDYCTGFLRSFRYENGQAVDERSWDVGDLGSVLSFGEDGAGELYVLSVLSGNGRVYRLEAAP
jgi:glucose/arabinose dehydrogenase